MAEQTEQKVPQIRFKAFDEEWSETTLGKLADIVRGASPRPIKDPKWFDDKSTIGWLRISDVTQQDGRIYYLLQRISKAGEEKTRVLTEPHLLLSIAASVGKPVVNYVQTGVHDGFLIFQNPIFDQEFMFQWMKMFEPQWQKYGQPGSQVNLNSDIVKNQPILIPKENEQSQIGSYFEKLDRLITLHQRKHEKLVTLKKAMLKQMFPAPGATIPEIRFKGFSSLWEEKAFDDIVNRVTLFSTNADLPRVEYEDIVSGSGRLNKDIFKKRSSKKGIEFEVGDVLFGKLRPYLKNWLLAGFNGLAVGDFWVLRSNGTDTRFIYHLIQTESFEAIANQSAGSKMPRSDWKLVSGSLFRVPEDPAEQAKIGTYFRHLDELIAQHGVQVEKLKQLKTACLEKMFV